jgi:site-specific DNA-methyltransferase (adenine-specific)/modification methylase
MPAWKRREVFGDATLYLGDCLAVMPELGPVDAVVTDPPYGIAYTKGAGGLGKHNRRNLEPIFNDDHPFDPAPILKFEQILIWGADRFRARLPETGTFIAWHKAPGMGPADSFVDAEFAWCNWREPRNSFALMWKGIASAKQGEPINRLHPSQKPIPLMEWCIRKTEGLILDPFMGSGTTGVACMNLGRKFIGIEIEEKYFDIACRRISLAANQQRIPLE